jgi:hypothetical protein
MKSRQKLPKKIALPGQESDRMPQTERERFPSVPKAATAFPRAWEWLVDEAIPAWVKSKYSPRESWKGKPFIKDDAKFFFRGIEELSELFTEERPRAMPAYLNHPKFRSAYLLYWVPLQASKFLTLFELHSKAIDAAIEHGRKTGKMVVADLGSGPGTASLALLLRLLELKDELPKIELHWIDMNRDTMEDGKELAQKIATSFPKLRDKLTIRTHVGQWKKLASSLPSELSLILMGHLLNESPDSRSLQEDPHSLSLWEGLFNRAHGGGILMVEPAARRPSHQLSKLRDGIIDSGLVEKDATALWGPCLHAKKCPLSDGRDWCHFSIPTRVPGKWFFEFSKGLGSERLWIKFSYVWFAAKSAPSPLPERTARRVISDPLKMGRVVSVLLCEPEIPGRLTGPEAARLHRGDLWKVRK